MLGDTQKLDKISKDVRSMGVKLERIHDQQVLIAELVQGISEVMATKADIIDLKEENKSQRNVEKIIVSQLDQHSSRISKLESRTA